MQLCGVELYLQRRIHHVFIMQQIDRRRTYLKAMRIINVSITSILVAACFTLIGCSQLPEATFDLAPESRLPAWFRLPPGYLRSDVTVSMSYYVEPSKRTATFTLYNGKTKELMKVSGVERGMEPITLKHQKPELPSDYPAYEIIDANGITEVIEHRKQEPLFYINDDPAVWAELGIARH